MHCSTYFSADSVFLSSTTVAASVNLTSVLPSWCQRGVLKKQSSSITLDTKKLISQLIGITAC